MTRDELENLFSAAEQEKNLGNYAVAEALGAEAHQSVYTATSTSAEERVQLDARHAILVATIAFRRGDFERALELNEHACKLSESIGDVVAAARAYLGMGSTHARRGDASLALEHFTKALEISEERNDTLFAARALVNIGSLHAIMSNGELSLDFYQRALSVYQSIGDRSSIALVKGNIGGAYARMAVYDKALEYFLEALHEHQELGQKPQVAANYSNVAMTYDSLGMYEKALETIGIVQSMFEELGEQSKLAGSFRTAANIYSKSNQFDSAVDYFNRALGMYVILGQKAELATTRAELGLAFERAGLYDQAIEANEQAIQELEEIGWTIQAAGYKGSIGAMLSDPEYSGFDAKRAEDLMVSALETLGETGSVEDSLNLHYNLSNLYEYQDRPAEAFVHFKKFIEIERKINVEELAKQQRVREQEKLLEAARTRAMERESILNNILPEEITARLIKGEKPIADHFESVSCLFMDIVGFTPLAATITASQVVHLLNAIFSAADVVMREFGLEKIKTIGDAYMAVAGAPIVQEDHAERAAKAALKLLDVMNSLVVHFPENYGDRSWIADVPEIQVRIGLHCGPAAAGVVGENKFLYDLWGDAVNTASRMESHGKAGSIHVSEEFVNTLSKNPAPQTGEFELVDRGEVFIKGKGNMRTFFLQRAQ